MKKVVKLFSLVLVMVVVLTGCKTKGTKEELTTGIDKTEKSYGYIVKYGYGYDVNESKDDYLTIVDSYTSKGENIIVNELEIKDEKTISDVKMFNGYGAYDEIIDGVTTRYVYQNDTWNKKEVPTVNFFSSLKKLISNSKIEEVETYNEDIKGKIFYMSTDSKHINDYLNDSNMVQNADAIETNIDKYVIILDKEGYLYSIQIMDGTIKFIDSNKEEVNGNLKFNNVYFEEIYDNEDISKDVYVPQEVKDSVVQNNTPVTNDNNTNTSNVTSNITNN